MVVEKYIDREIRKMSNEIMIKRFSNNPLLEPGSASWMQKNVFNCGVIRDDDGLYKMLFRGAWTKDQSKSDCGLAISPTGVEWYVVNKPVLRHGFNDYCKDGVEDPRIINWIDGYKYIFATASSSVGGRIGIWRTKNFFEYEWVGIPFNQEDKDAAILSEPIDGWAYLLHRKSPNICISKTRDLTLKGGWQDSQILSRIEDWYSMSDISPKHIETVESIDKLRILEN